MPISFPKSAKLELRTDGGNVVDAASVDSDMRDRHIVFNRQLAESTRRAAMSQSSLDTSAEIQRVDAVAVAKAIWRELVPASRQHLDLRGVVLVTRLRGLRRSHSAFRTSELVRQSVTCWSLPGSSVAGMIKSATMGRWSEPAVHLMLQAATSIWWLTQQ